MLIEIFKKRTVVEIERLGLTVEEFATERMGMPVRRFEGMLCRETLRIRRVDEIAMELGQTPFTLLKEGGNSRRSLLQFEYPSSSETLKQTIPYYIEREGLSANRIAKVLNITRQALSKDLVSGNVNLLRLSQIAEILEVEPWKFLLPLEVVCKHG